MTRFALKTALAFRTVERSVKIAVQMTAQSLATTARALAPPNHFATDLRVLNSVLIMPHRPSPQTNVVNNKSADSKIFFLAISLDAQNSNICSVVLMKDSCSHWIFRQFMLKACKSDGRLLECGFLFLFRPPYQTAHRCG